MPKTTEPAAPEQQHHYFASTAFDWAVAPTRAEAVAKVARAAGTDQIKRQVKAHRGLYCWSCRVNTPQSAHYTINQYAPSRLMLDGKEIDVRVPTDRPRELRIQNVKGHVAVEDELP